MSEVLQEEKKAAYIPDDAKIEQIPLSEIFHDVEFNCRGQIAPIDVVELAQNIKNNGLIQPIIVQPYDKGPKGTRYRIVAGYRRHMAHVVNRADHINAIVIPGLSDVDAKIINLSENLNRQDLNLLQESKAVYELVKKGLTQQQMAERLHVSRGWIQIRVYTLRLPAEIQEDIKAGWIKSEHIHALNGLEADEQFDLVKKIKDQKMAGTGKARVAISKKKINKDPNRSSKRDHSQIEKMMEHILDNVGQSLATIALAWAAGNVSTMDLYNGIKEYDDDYEIPEEDVTAL